ncbi:hypothetical protein GCK72_006329 [Caenorhabditis remanei]|uniref:Uncharacterized protein n=1 Tax=Caenorhabditis remanei TaxID=31234 RepID=A0A6A5HKF6_CAERE|nr:hypothetical protein GCK72_006329 [Caenorhabditis remanei]KAF1766372.1 hypothetical protein GCK72_006329 [Caenorhabditis remanei]
MRTFILLLCFLKASFTGRLQIILPNNLPPDSESSSLDSVSLLELNKHILGVESSARGNRPLANEDLFEKPKALIIISITGLDNFNYDGRVYNFTDEFDSQQIHESLKRNFGEEMIHANVNSSGIFGSSHFKRNTVMDEQSLENQDIDNMNKLAEVIRGKDRKNANVVDYYRIHLDASNARNEKEKERLEQKMKYGIDSLQKAIDQSYGLNVITEIYTHDKTTKTESDKLKEIWKKFQITGFRNTEYPAIFAISALVCFCILFGVVAMLWFMFDESDMGRNSLMYPSAARQKKD